MAQQNRNFDAMRQDAIRRSREMHRRAAPPQSAPPLRPQPPPEPPRPELPPPPPKEPPIPPELSGMLHSLLTEWDGEKMALAGLMYLLYKEGADPALLLALLYILL